ncbi:MAG: sugar ABC transporter substrate-binding protein [Planctomycetota bacterium]|nr:sugar ABC transporter substrate-binding protein [Planctomycetota bacterium]
MKSNYLNIACLIYAAFIFQWVGCTTSDSPSPSTAENDNTGQPRIGLVMKSLANEFFSTMQEGAIQHQLANQSYELICNGIKDETDLARQVALVEEMVASGVNAIVIAPADSKALIPTLRRAMQAGVVVVNIDNQLDKSIMEQESVSIPFVGPDNRSGSKMVGSYLADQLRPGDQVAILEGKTTAFNGVQRRLGFEDAARDAKLEIVTSQSADWETNKANALTISILSEYPNLTAIMASNDSMALGAVAAIKSLNRTGQVKVVGFDNITAIQELIRNDIVLATADQHAAELAVYGIEAALQQLSDQNAELLDVQTPVDLITKETLEQ